MGEQSKRIGDQGEKLVQYFLSLIGWQYLQKNQDIPCQYPQKHRISKTNRKSHGVDFYHSFPSPLCAHTLETIVISVKYSEQPYSVKSTHLFRQHLTELVQTMQCFQRSPQQQSIIDECPKQGIKRDAFTGVLFELTHAPEKESICPKLSEIKLNSVPELNIVHLIDNAQFSFIYNALEFIKLKYPNHEYKFHYSGSGQNYSDETRNHQSKVMPSEYLTAQILPIRLESKNKSVVQEFCLVTAEGFSREHFQRLYSYAIDLSQQFPNRFIFLFPDYNGHDHESDVNAVRHKMSQHMNKDIEAKVDKFEQLDFRRIFNV